MDVYKTYDVFFSQSVQCVRDKGVSLESLKNIDFKLLPTNTHELIHPNTNINVHNMKSDKEKSSPRKWGAENRSRNTMLRED